MKSQKQRSVTPINLTHEQVSGTWMLLPLKQSVFCTVANSLHRGRLLCVCVWATRPFECDEWAVDIEQRGWAGQGPGGWTKAVTVQKNTMLSHLRLHLIMQDNTCEKDGFNYYTFPQCAENLLVREIKS